MSFRVLSAGALVAQAPGARGASRGMSSPPNTGIRLEVLGPMPSMTHQTLVSLLREHPPLGMQLFQTATGMQLPQQALLRETFAQFTDLTPPEYSADATYIIDDGAGDDLGAVIFEVQLEPKAEKRLSWLEYVSNCHRRLKKPVTLVAIAVTEAMAAWCAQPYVYDHVGDNAFRPLVVGPGEIPRITDIEQAKELVPLALLSVAAHGQEAEAEEVGLAALLACATLPHEQGRLFADFVMSMLSSAARQALEKLMAQPDYEYQSDWARGYVAQGQQKVLLKLLGLKYGELPEAAVARVRQADSAELDRWTERILTAQSLDEVFA